MAFSASDKGMLESYVEQSLPLEDMFTVRGKTALVTGGTSGLGFNISLRLLQGGANVVVSSHSTLEEEAAMPLFEQAGFAGKVAFKLCNICDEDDVAALVDFAVETFGSLDIYVNSAATWNYAHIYDLPKEDLERVFQTNVYGAFYAMKYVSRHMVDTGTKGKIVLISSDCPYMPFPVFGGYPHYASSKAAVMGLVTETAKELKRFGILVNSIAPGGMVTPGSAGNLCSEGISEEKQDEFYDELSIWATADLLPVDQVATMAYMMCTPASDGITGETIFVNGGANHNIFSRQVAIDAYPPEDD